LEHVATSEKACGGGQIFFVVENIFLKKDYKNLKYHKKI
jgi:hypothetical protein